MNTTIPAALPEKLADFYRLFFKKYAWYFLGLVIIALLSALFRLEVDYELQHIIDSVHENPHAPMIALLIYFVFHKTMHHVVHFLQKLMGVFYKPKILQNVTEMVYVQVMRHSLYWFDSHRSGEISAKIQDFQDSLLGLINGLFYALSRIFIVVFSLIFLYTVSTHATVVLLIFTIIYVPIVGFFVKRQMDAEKQCATVRQDAFGTINDSIANVFSIKTMGKLSWEFALKLTPILKKWSDYEGKSRQYHAYYVDVTDTILVVSMGIVQITLVADLYQKGLLTPGQFTFVTVITLQLHKELSELIDNVVFLCNPKLAALKAAYSFIQLDAGETEIGLKSLPNIKGKIEYRNVSFEYDDKNVVLKNLNITIMPGEKVGIVGPSGAGKSTFIKALLKYFPLSGGDILMDDIPISGISQESVCQHIALIPQDIPFFHRSILDNIRMVNPQASTDQIQHVCRKAHIHDDIMAMPDQYHTILGERGMKLSGGQRQRLAIARALLKQAPIMILDEATSSLDSPTERLIQDSLDRIILETKATTLMIAHRLSTLSKMDRIIVLEKGRIVQNGHHDVLISEPNGLYKKLWDSQNATGHSA
jgi:ATP-binding cassette subfamily B protein